MVVQLSIRTRCFIISLLGYSTITTVHLLSSLGSERNLKDEGLPEKPTEETKRESYYSFYWTQLPQSSRDVATQLGFDEGAWNHDSDIPIYEKTLEELTLEECRALESLGLVPNLAERTTLHQSIVIPQGYDIDNNDMKMELLVRGLPMYSDFNFDTREILNTPIRLVVSVCSESLEWLPDYLSGLQTLRDVTIVSKCGTEIPESVLGALRQTEKDGRHKIKVMVVEMDNVGRCDHTYAHWIRQNYGEIENDAADNSVVLFLKDNRELHQRAHSHQSLEGMVASALHDGFGCLLFSKRGHSIFHKTSKLGEYVIGDYFSAGSNFSSPYDNLADWHQDALHLSDLGVTLDEIVPVCYGGNFAARARNLHKVPLEVWQRMEKSLERGDNIVEGHFAERTWASLIRDPISKEVKDWITKRGIVMHETNYLGKYEYAGLC